MTGDELDCVITRMNFTLRIQVGAAVVLVEAGTVEHLQNVRMNWAVQGRVTLQTAPLVGLGLSR